MLNRCGKPSQIQGTLSLIQYGHAYTQSLIHKGITEEGGGVKEKVISKIQDYHFARNIWKLNLRKFRTKPGLFFGKVKSLFNAMYEGERTLLFREVT